MSRKNIILIGVIVLMLAGSGLVLYNGFGGSSSGPSSTQTANTNVAANPNAGLAADETPATPLPGGASPAAGSVTTTSPITSTKILPLGTKFDLSLVKKYNANVNNYPKVDPSEVGTAVGALVHQ